jgi:hypothetical protein
VRDLAFLQRVLNVDPCGKEAFDMITKLRTETIPRAFVGVPAEVFVMGETALRLDAARLDAMRGMWSWSKLDPTQGSPSSFGFSVPSG